jgi:squalene-hopene/tetraprenyl-beta-curcumene cyclase
MNTMELVRFVERAQPRPIHRAAAPLFYTELAGPARQAILRARQRLMSEQRDDGSWIGTQTGDASLPSQLIFVLTFLEQDSATVQQASNAILRTQLADGGWSRKPNSEADLNVSVQAYLALKLAGIEASDPRLRSARTRIRAMGGADQADATTRRFLALFGQITYDICPASPPEPLLFGHDVEPSTPVHAIIWAHRPVHEVALDRGVRELFVGKPLQWPSATDHRQLSRQRRIKRIATNLVCAAVRICEQRGWLALRSRALNAAEARLAANLGETSIRGLSFSELAWHAIAMRAIGLPVDHEATWRCLERLDSMIQVNDTLDEAVPVLSTSPLSDTLGALQSLTSSGLDAKHRSMKSGAKYLARSRRDRLQLPPTAVAQLLQLISNAANLDATHNDTLPPQMEVGQALYDRTPRAAFTNRLLERSRQLSETLTSHLVRQQRRDGSWGSVAQTGAILEAIATAKCNLATSAIDRAIQFLRTRQCADGRWSEQSSSQDRLTTAVAVRGLAAAGIMNDDDAVCAGMNWLAAEQQPNGCWTAHDFTTFRNSSDESDDDSEFTTPSVEQTASALLAFVAAGQAHHQAALRAVSFLVKAQADDGGWRELDFTQFDDSTGQWLRNELNAISLPLLALSRWIVAATSTQSEIAESMALRLVGAAADN